MGVGVAQPVAWSGFVGDSAIGSLTVTVDGYGRLSVENANKIMHKSIVLLCGGVGPHMTFFGACYEFSIGHHMRTCGFGYTITFNSLHLPNLELRNLELRKSRQLGQHFP
jgi:hypothetical protein